MMSQHSSKTASALVEPIFEQSRPGTSGLSLPPIGTDTTPINEWLPEALQRKTEPRLPEVAQLDMLSVAKAAQAISSVIS